MSFFASRLHSSSVVFSCLLPLYIWDLYFQLAFGFSSISSTALLPSVWILPFSRHVEAFTRSPFFTALSLLGVWSACYILSRTQQSGVVRPKDARLSDLR